MSVPGFYLQPETWRANPPCSVSLTRSPSPVKALSENFRKNFSRAAFDRFRPRGEGLFAVFPGVARDCPGGGWTVKAAPLLTIIGTKPRVWTKKLRKFWLFALSGGEIPSRGPLGAGGGGGGIALVDFPARRNTRPDPARGRPPPWIPARPGPTPRGFSWPPQAGGKPCGTVGEVFGTSRRSNRFRTAS